MAVDVNQVDEALLARARSLLGTNDSAETVNEALRLLVQVQRQRGLRALRGEVRWEGDLDEMRRDRFEHDPR